MEVVVSLLLSAIMVSSVMSVALTAKVSSGKADRKTLCSQEARRLSGDLKGFVTSYYDYNTNAFLPVAQMGAIAGPALPGSPGAASWQWASMPGPNGVNVVDSCNGSPPCYALSLGVHQLTNYLPGWMEGAPYNARAQYTVSGGVGTGQLYAPSVDVSVTWDDP